MYAVNNTTFDFFSDAVKAAKAVNANVILVATGDVKWSPAPPVSSAKLRRYQSQLNAYNASVGK
jgi:hypothetical protein